jgi:hypothetical protein
MKKVFLSLFVLAFAFELPSFAEEPSLLWKCQGLLQSAPLAPRPHERLVEVYPSTLNLFRQGDTLTAQVCTHLTRGCETGVQGQLRQEGTDGHKYYASSMQAVSANYTHTAELTFHLSGAAWNYSGATDRYIALRGHIRSAEGYQVDVHGSFTCVSP